MNDAERELADTFAKMIDRPSAEAAPVSTLRRLSRRHRVRRIGGAATAVVACTGGVAGAVTLSTKDAHGPRRVALRAAPVAAAPETTESVTTAPTTTTESPTTVPPTTVPPTTAAPLTEPPTTAPPQTVPPTTAPPVTVTSVPSTTNPTVPVPPGPNDGPYTKVMTPDGNGYWEFNAHGLIVPSGDAPFFGDLHRDNLPTSIVALASLPSNTGYYLAAANGGVFTFGGAHFYGSPGGQNTAPIVSMTVTASGHGYRLVDAHGTHYTYGDATS